MAAAYLDAETTAGWLTWLFASTVVLLPVWAAGHLMSMLDAGKRLLARSGGALSLTVLVMQAPGENHRSEVAAHIQREEASGLEGRAKEGSHTRTPSPSRSPLSF